MQTKPPKKAIDIVELNTFLFSKKMLIFMARIDKMLKRIAVWSGSELFVLAFLAGN